MRCIPVAVLFMFFPSIAAAQLYHFEQDIQEDTQNPKASEVEELLTGLGIRTGRRAMDDFDETGLIYDMYLNLSFKEAPGLLVQLRLGTLGVSGDTTQDVNAELHATVYGLGFGYEHALEREGDIKDGDIEWTFRGGVFLLRACPKIT